VKHGCLFKKENVAIFQKNVMSFLAILYYFLIKKYRVYFLTRFTKFVYLASDIFRRN